MEKKVPKSAKTTGAAPIDPTSRSATPLIVGIGASAGGIEAFRSFFASTGPDTGMAYGLVQHLSPDHKSMLADLLSKSTSMPVIEAVDGLQVMANNVFVIPPDATMTISSGHLQIVKPAPPRHTGGPSTPFFSRLPPIRARTPIASSRWGPEVMARWGPPRSEKTADLR